MNCILECSTFQTNIPLNLTIKPINPKIIGLTGTKDMLADAPWTTFLLKTLESAGHSPRRDNVLLANAECSNPSRGLRFS